MKRITIILAFLLTGVLTTTRAQAPQVPNPQRVERLSEAFPGVKREWEIVHSNPQVGFSVLNQGIVVIDRASKQIIYYDDNGNIVWTKTAPGIGPVKGNQNGTYLCTIYPLNEDENRIEILDAGGSLVWSRILQAPVKFSKTGDYLFTYATPMKSMPLTVFETKTGKPLWTKDDVNRHYKIESLGGDRLTYLHGARIFGVDIQTGQHLWNFNIMHEIGDDRQTVWEMISGDDGEQVAALSRHYHPDRHETFLFMFNRNGDLLWRKHGPAGMHLIDITPDGRFMAVLNYNDMETLSLINAQTGDLIWTIDRRIRDNGHFMTQHVLMLRQKMNQSLVVVMGQQGQLKRQIILEKGVSVFEKHTERSQAQNIRGITSSKAVRFIERIDSNGSIKIRLNSINTKEILQ